MDSYEHLYAKALENRDEAIRKAKKEYLRRLDEIDRLLRSLGEDYGPRRRYVASRSAEPTKNSLRGITASKAAQLVLREFGPLTAVEITVLIQKLGCRTGHDPRIVARSIRSALSYHKGRFRRDDLGRWFLLG